MIQNATGDISRNMKLDSQMRANTKNIKYQETIQKKRKWK